MRSGFPYDPTVEPSFREAIPSDLDRSWIADELLALAADKAARAGELVGEQEYNNLNHIALQHLVEEVTGQPLAAVLSRDLLDPAGLERVWFQDAEQPQPPLMVAEEYYAEETVDEDGPWLPPRSLATAKAGAGAMAGDAAGAARWGYLLSCGFLINPWLVEQMAKRQQPDDFYWLGTELMEGSSVGHLGGFPSTLCYLRVWHQDDISVTVLIARSSDRQDENAIRGYLCRPSTSRWCSSGTLGPSAFESITAIPPSTGTHGGDAAVVRAQPAHSCGEQKRQRGPGPANSAA